MIKWVLLLTVYSGGIPTVERPVFFATQEACVGAYTDIATRNASKRKRTDGGCFDMSNPAIRNHVIDEMAQRQLNNR